LSLSSLHRFVSINTHSKLGCSLIEELETLGRSEYRALESALARLTQHLLKWQDQAGKRSKSWLSTIRQQRRQIAQLLRKNPSFKARLAKAIAESYSDGWSDAAFETELPLATFPDVPTWNQLTKEDWLPESQPS
jgi:hypothetical protein